jgi:predicted dehydrogenase
LREASRRHLVIGTGYNARFRVNPLRARELIAENAIGRLLTMHFSLLYDLGPFNAAVMGGTKSWLNQPENIGNIIDGLPHAIDLFRWFTGAEVKSVSALCRTFMPSRPLVEDTTIGLIEFDNGALCSVNTTCALPGPFPGQDLRLTMIGSTGLLELDAFGDMHLSDRQGWRLASRQPAVNPEDPNLAFGDVRMKAYCTQMSSFIDGIRGKPMVMGNGADGRAGVAVCLAMLQSSRERRWIELA